MTYSLHPGADHDIASALDFYWGHDKSRAGSILSTPRRIVFQAEAFHPAVRRARLDEDAVQSFGQIGCDMQAHVLAHGGFQFQVLGVEPVASFGQAFDR